MISYLKLLILLIISLLIFGCIAPTFESVSVKKGSHDWIGFAGGYRSFDHNDFFEFDGNNDYIDTYGIVASLGRDYGFTENIGIVWQGAFYYYRDTYFGSGQEFQGSRILPTGSLCLKYEPTRATSRIAFSVSTGPSFPEALKTTFMVGLRQNTRDVIWLGLHVGSYLPYEVFINAKPFSNIGMRFYSGYRLPLSIFGPNRFNIAGGIGLEF